MYVLRNIDECGYAVEAKPPRLKLNLGGSGRVYYWDHFSNRVGSGGAAVLPHHPAYLRTRRFPITFTRSFYGLKIVTLVVLTI